jgi:ATPase complex subunit ATP10
VQRQDICHFHAVYSNIRGGYFKHLIRVCLLTSS